MSTISPTFKFINIETVDSEPHVFTVTLNRPEKRNAMNSVMWTEISKAFEYLGHRGDVRCILLKGAGSSFCSGIDFTDPKFGVSFDNSGDDDNTEEEEEEPDTARNYLGFLPQIMEMQQCFTIIEKINVPVVALVHGKCIGAGVDLICCADVRFCTPDAVFSVREIKLGLAADIGTLQRLPKIASNDSRIREVCLTGEDFDSKEAFRIGLVSKILLDDGETQALKVCKKIAGNSPVAIAGTKQSLVYSRDNSVEEGLKHIAYMNAALLRTNDLTESFLSMTSRTRSRFPNLLPSSRL